MCNKFGIVTIVRRAYRNTYIIILYRSGKLPCKYIIAFGVFPTLSFSHKWKYNILLNSTTVQVEKVRGGQRLCHEWCVNSIKLMAGCVSQLIKQLGMQPDIEQFLAHVTWNSYQYINHTIPWSV